MTCGKQKKTDAIFGWGFISSENGPTFSAGSGSENDIGKWKPEKSPFSGLSDSQTGLAIRKRSFSVSDTLL